MTKKTRLILLLICVVLFLLIAPYIVLYSLGYRVDFLHQKITITGGIYVRVEPSPADISIDSGNKITPGLFSNSVFVQNLLPGQHSVSIQKDGYIGYEKTLLVREKEVTKLEEVTLFKKDIAFSAQGGSASGGEQLPTTEEFELLTKKPATQYIIKSGNLYYANTPENATLTATQKATPVIKNVIAFEASDTNIIWLGTDGLLKNFSFSTKTSEPLSNTPYLINKKQPYVLETLAGNIFLTEGSTAFWFNKTTAAFEPFYVAVNGFVLSPDAKKIAYYNDHELWYWLPNAQVAPAKILLQETKETITQVYWLNNNYMVFATGNSIVITEIDPRGNINTITLPQTISLALGDVAIKNPAIFFNSQDKKLYILSGEAVYVSERLIP